MRLGQRLECEMRCVVGFRQHQFSTSREYFLGLFKDTWQRQTLTRTAGALVRSGRLPELSKRGACLVQRHTNPGLSSASVAASGSLPRSSPVTRKP
jgi:hypothetical protein